MLRSFEKKSEVPTQWVVGENGIVNSRFGIIRVINVTQDGRPVYEGVNFSESDGSIVIVADIDDAYNPRIAVVEQERFAVIDPKYLNEHWQKGVPDIFDSEMKAHMGLSMKELPRGFNESKDVFREGEEETGRKIKPVAQIGNVNANTANTATSPRIVVAQATKLPSEWKQDPNEIIKQVLWLSPEEVVKTISLCGFSMAALWVFRQWCLNNPEPVWKIIGGKL